MSRNFQCNERPRKQFLPLWMPCEGRACHLTDDAIWHCQNFGRKFSVGEFCFEDRFCTSRKGGTGRKVGGSTALPDSTWWQWQLLVEKPWSMMGGPFVCFLARTGVETLPSPCRDSISGNLGSV